MSELEHSEPLFSLKPKTQIQPRMDAEGAGETDVDFIVAQLRDELDALASVKPYPNRSSIYRSSIFFTRTDSQISRFCSFRFVGGQELVAKFRRILEI